jgi:hypothetical protein
MSAPQSTDEQDVDTHDPAGMAAFMRRRAQHSREFVKLTSEEQIRHFMQQWQKNILPHFAFRFEQAAEMMEHLASDCHELAQERDELTQKVCELITQRQQAQHERDCAVEDVKRLEFIQRDFHNVGDVAEIRRLRTAIRGYVRTKLAQSGEHGHYWWTLQEIAKERQDDVPAQSWTAGDGPCNCKPRVWHSADCSSLQPPAVDVSGGLKAAEIENACTHEFRPIDSSGQTACVYCNERPTQPTRTP